MTFTPFGDAFDGARPSVDENKHATPQHFSIAVNDGPGPDPVFGVNTRPRVTGAVGAVAGLAAGAMAPLHPFLRTEVAATTATLGFALGGLASGRAGAEVPPVMTPGSEFEQRLQGSQEKWMQDTFSAAANAKDGDPQEALRLADEAANAAQVSRRLSDDAVAELKSGIAELYPSKAGNPAWLARATAHLMMNGVVGVNDEKDEKDNTCRYGLKTLHNTGIRRDFARSVSTALINYTPSFGVANLGTEAMRQADLPTPASWLAGGMAIGFGQEHPMILGLTPSRYTRAPTADERAHAMYEFADRASFWPFGIDHALGDVSTAFNVGYLRFGTGYAAAAMTGVQRAHMDLATAHFEPAWADPDHPDAAKLIQSLRGTDAVAAGEFLNEVVRNLGNGPLSNFEARRGLVRMIFAMACAAPRAAAGMFPMGPEARMSLMTATNGLLGGWGVINRYIARNFAPPANQGHPTPLVAQPILPDENAVREMLLPPELDQVDLEAGLVPTDIAAAPPLADDPLLTPGDHNV